MTRGYGRCPNSKRERSFLNIDLNNIVYKVIEYKNVKKWRKENWHRHNQEK